MTEDTGRELRLVVTVDDLHAALHRYRDVLGLPELARFPSPGEVVVLDAGRATIELADATHAASIDEVEVGRRVGGLLRVAIHVGDVDRVTEDLAAAGSEVLGPPTTTPWGSRNARLLDPDGVQLTLFAGESDLPDAT